MDVVFSLQRAGADAVFSWQFPVEVTDSPGSGGYGSRYAKPVGPKKREEARKDLTEQRAAEIADAVVARAKAEPEALKALAQPPSALDDVMRAWVTVSVDFGPEVLPVTLPATEPESVRVSLAALDEDAILAATMLLMRRRK